jgi:type IV pilus assembly protein PilC
LRAYLASAAAMGAEICVEVAQRLAAESTGRRRGQLARLATGMRGGQTFQEAFEASFVPIRPTVRRAASWYTMRGLIALVVFIVAFFLVSIVPQFVEIFNQLGAELPGLTLLLVELSYVMVHHAGLLLFCVVIILVPWYAIRRRAIRGGGQRLQPVGPVVCHSGLGVVVTVIVMTGVLIGIAVISLYLPLFCIPKVIGR